MAERQTPGSGPTGQFIERLGDEVRRRRGEAGLTMEQFATTAGISRRMLGQIELGTANPSLVTIGKIARALGTDFASLVGDTRSDAVVVTEADEVSDLWSSSTGSHAALAVASTLRPSAELWDWTLEPGDCYHAEPDPPNSEELFLVITGTLTLIVEGTEKSLSVGSSARIPTDRPYAYRNDGRVPIRFVRIAHVAT